MSDDDNTPPEWLNELPAPLREAPFLSKAKDVDEAVGKLAHAAQLVGTSVRIPQADASAEDKEKFFAKLAEVEGVARLPTYDDEEGMKSLMAKLGTPEEAGDYALPELDDFEWDDNTAKTLREYALEAGMTKKQFEVFAAKIAAQDRQASEDAQAALEDARKALRVDWGDTLEEREDLIRGYLEHSDAPESMRGLLDDRNLPLDTMNWLYSIAKQFKGEVNPINRDGKQPEATKDPAQIQEELLAIRKDLFGMRETDPRYEGLKNKMVKLHKDLARITHAA